MAIITLTTDLGSKDYLSGAVKGILLSINPAFTLVDISHSITPFMEHEAVYAIRNSAYLFPQHSYHLVIVNPFETSDTGILLAFARGQYFVCPNNGLLSMILNGAPEQCITLHGTFSTVLEWAALAGKAIASLEDGASLLMVGYEPTSIVEKNESKPLVGDDYIEGRIISIDRFGNVVLDITRHEFEAARNGRNFTIVIKSNETISRISTNYSGAPEGFKVAFFNAAGHLEIAINKGRAASLLGLHTFDEKANQAMLAARRYYQRVRIYFT